METRIEMFYLQIQENNVPRIKVIVTTLLIVVIITAGIILLTRTRQKETKPSPTTWPETSPATFPTSLSGPTLPAMRTPIPKLME